MKKLLSMIFALTLMLTLFAPVTVSAADGEVLVGTPVIDGKIDDIYKQSLTIVYDGSAEKNAEGANWWDATGKFYALYDNKYVYLAAEVKDNDVVSASDRYLLRDPNPYGSDVVEFRLDFNHDYATGYNSSESFFKIGADATGKRKYTYFSEVVDIDTVIVKTAITSDGYVIEVAVPHSTNDLNKILDVGKLGLKIWLYDLRAESAGIASPVETIDFVQYAMIYEGESIGDCVYYDLSSKKAVSNGTPVVEDTTKAPETTVAPETTEAPETTAEPDDTEAADTTATVDDTTAADTTEVEDTTAEDVTTGADDTTEAADTTAADDTETELDTTEADDTTAEPETTKTDEDDTTTAPKDDESGISPIVIIGIIAAVVIIAGVAVIASKKRK